MEQITEEQLVTTTPTTRRSNRQRGTSSAETSEDDSLVLQQLQQHQFVDPRPPPPSPMVEDAGGGAVFVDDERYAEIVLSDEDLGEMIMLPDDEEEEEDDDDNKGSFLISPFANRLTKRWANMPGLPSTPTIGRRRQHHHQQARQKQQKIHMTMDRSSTKTTGGSATVVAIPSSSSSSPSPRHHHEDEGDADDEAERTNRLGGGAAGLVESVAEQQQLQQPTSIDESSTSNLHDHQAHRPSKSLSPSSSTTSARFVDDKPWRQRLRHSSSLPQRLTGTRSHGSARHNNNNNNNNNMNNNDNTTNSTGTGQPPRVLRYIRSLASGSSRKTDRGDDDVVLLSPPYSAEEVNRSIVQSPSDEQQPALEVDDGNHHHNTTTHDDDRSAQLSSSSAGTSSSSSSSSGDTSVVDEVELECAIYDSWDEDFLVESDEEYVGKEQAVDWAGMTALPNTFCNNAPPPMAVLLANSARSLIGNNNNSAKDINNNNIAATAANPQQAAPIITTTTTTSSTSSYLDSSMWHAPLTQLEGNRFVWEHALLLQAVLQLLVEREQVGVEGSLDVADNIWKKGPLKKISFVVGGRRIKKRPTAGGTWKVKYVELRRGNLCYYEDSLGPSSGRKTIHLRQADTIVQESSYRGPGFVFELLIQGSPAQYWTARSEEERQSWIRAIRGAMIGEENNRYRELDLTPHQPSLKVYTRLRDVIQIADMQELYLEGIQAAAQEIESMQVPVQWVREQHKKRRASSAHTRTESSAATQRRCIKRENSAHHKRLKNSISEFWKSMRQVSFSINGFAVPRNSPMAAERVVGSLTRCFLEFDKAYLAAGGDDDDPTSSAQNEITELQAVSYARSILVAVLRGKEQEDLEAVVEDLLAGRPELVTVSVIPPEEDQLASLTTLDVSFAGEDLPDDFDEHDSEDMSSWIWLARRKNSSGSVPSKQWKRRFAVLSGAVLSFYEAASPRPHGLRGQVVLHPDTTLATKDVEPSREGGKMDTTNRGRHVVVLSTQGNEHLLCFADESDMSAWKAALQDAIPTPSGVAQEHQRENPPAEKTAPAKMLVKGAERVIKGAADGSIRGGIRVIRGAKDSGMKAMKIATDGSMKVLRGAVGRLRSSSTVSTKDERQSPLKDRRSSLLKRVPSVQVLLDQSKVPGKREPTVQCVVQRALTFVIRGAGTDENDEPWMSVQATWYQAFLMSGGPSGRLNCGDALVELDFMMDAKTYDEEEEYVGEIDVL